MRKTIQQRYAGLVALLVAAALVAAPARLQAQGVKVIVHPASGVTALSTAELTSLFLKKTAKFPDGTAAVPVDLRVVDTDGFTMAQQTQFTDTVTVKTSPDADCFGPPGGSGAEKTLSGPTALGAVWDASQADADLRPIWLTDQFGFGLGLCAIGGKVPPSSGFWYLKVNHVGAQVGGDQLVLEPLLDREPAEGGLHEHEPGGGDGAAHQHAV